MKQHTAVAVLGISMIAFSSVSVAGNGFYLGAGVPYNSIKGDFDGKSYYTSSSDIIIVPTMDSAFGWGILGGYTADKLDFEIGYAMSKHNGTWAGAKGKSDYSVFDFDVKYHFITEQPLRPYGLIGLSFDQVKVQDGSASFSGRTGDATYKGAGFNLGAGVDYFIDDNFSLGLGAKYRFVKYTEAEGVMSSGTLPNSLSGNGYTVMLSGAYHF